ncbi:unnamed protein product [Leptidea sinapis]|uniref:Cytochrome P450 n=1 Tax=Leptidea sinapis TaxID=189913 RepID=A0A5E4R8Q1_9NEOP|nr:unnamed protein product [Leptidea sinapis]
MFVLLLSLLVPLLFLYYQYVKRSSRKWKLLSKYPGDYPLPIIGNALQLGFDADAASQKLLGLWRKHGMQNFRLTVGSEEWVIISDPDDVAGHYTTSKTMSHTLYLLAKHPEIQKKIYEEQVAVLKNNMSRKVTNHDLNEMKYLEAAIKETLRVLPTVRDQIVPAQASILMFFEAMYQNPKLFPEPEKYKPERFFDSMHSYAFIPFSAGPRNCLGFRFAWVAMKATISNIIRRYELTLAAPGTEPQFVYRIVTESTNGLNLKLKRRLAKEGQIVLINPHLSERTKIILNHPTELSKPVERNAAMMPFFGNSVSTSEGERWKSTRKLMAPSFSYKTLEKRIEHVNKYCGRLFEILDNHRDDDDIDMVVNIITQNFFSYWRNIRMIFMLTPFYKEMQDTIRTIKDTSTDIIRQRKVKLNQLIEDTKNNNRNVDDDVEQLIEDKVSDDACLLDKFLLSKSNNGDPTPDEIINEELTLVCWTGHYTTTMTMAHTLYCLAKHPEVQRRVFEEQTAIFKADLNKQATNHDLNEMKYLEAAIKESIRVIPTVTKIGRQLNNDLKFTGDKVIPADTTVLVFYEAIYKDPKLFPEPEKYYPERFFSSMHNHAFVPFSAGPRNCLAMKATLSNMIRKYELTLGNPGTEPHFAYRIITESTNGVHLKLKRRKK